MREYKFRGKRLDNGAWVYGNLVTYFNKPAIQDYAQTNGEIFSVDPETVGQYIVRTDRNEKEMYEGDIVSFKDSWDFADTDIPEKIGQVGFSDASFRIERAAMNHYRWMDYDCEVIGNRWDNPELLEEVRK